MFEVVGQALGEVVRFWNAPRIFKAEMRSFVRAMCFSDSIVCSLQFHTGFIVRVERLVGRLPYRADDELCSHHIEEPSDKIASPNQSIECELPGPTKPSKILFRFQSEEDPCPSCLPCYSLSHSNS